MAAPAGVSDAKLTAGRTRRRQTMAQTAQLRRFDVIENEAQRDLHAPARGLPPASVPEPRGAAGEPRQARAHPARQRRRDRRRDQRRLRPPLRGRVEDARALHLRRRHPPHAEEARRVDEAAAPPRLGAVRDRARTASIPQPKGVVGLVSPWNYPLFLTVSPLTSILAAGNRCMIKMASELEQPLPPARRRSSASTSRRTRSRSSRACARRTSRRCPSTTSSSPARPTPAAP